MTPLAGQRILLIGIGFYDYEAAIAAEFRALGAEVWVEDQNPPETRDKLAPVRRRFMPDTEAPLRRHHATMLERASAIGRLDHIVVIKGTMLDEAFLKALREVQPVACFTAYHWDSMARFPELIRRQALYDRVLTFDHADAAREPRFILRPLFYRPELRQAEPVATTIDLCFVGWLHHDRLKQVEAIRAQASSLGLSPFFYLSTGRWTSIKLHLSGKGQDVQWRPLPFARYVEKTAASKAVLDLPHPQQTGLTMRAIEAVGANKKLITTAADIAGYDFYRPGNIHILDAANPRIDLEFLTGPPAALPPDLVERYSLRAWALDVLGVTEPTGFLRDAEAPAAVLH
jgi:hypothetical protein